LTDDRDRDRFRIGLRADMACGYSGQNIVTEIGAERTVALAEN